MSAFHTCIARLAPSVVDNMYRQALLRWMIQFQRHRHPKQESWQHCYRPFGTAAVTKLDNTAEVRSGNAAHSEGCAGKTHTSYMTTWRSVGVRRGNVAYCLAFSAHTHHLYIYMHAYVLVSSRAPWHRLLGQRSLLRESQGECSSTAGTYKCILVVLLG